MSVSEYRDRLDALREQFSKTERFVRQSEHADGEAVEAFLDLFPEILDGVASQIATYESVGSEIAELSEELQRAKGGADTLRELSAESELGESDRELEAGYEATREQLRSTKAEYRELEAGIEELLDLGESLCAAVGNQIATTGAYNPTEADSDELDATSKAKLDSILREVTSEDRENWYDP
jgi:hypothetical protein